MKVCSKQLEMILHTSTLNLVRNFSNRWFKREHVEYDALKVGSCPHDDNYGQILMLSFSVWNLNHYII